MHKNELEQTSQEERMKFNKWTVGLAAGGVVSLASVVQADEAQKPMSQLQTAVSSTVLSGFVDTSIIWKPGTGDANLPGRQYDGPTKLDGFILNVVGLTLEKPLSEEQWTAGYKADLWFGPDAGTYRALVGNGGGDPNFAINFFFQAEDGIRDVAVTGVQTCALPISIRGGFSLARKCDRDTHGHFLRTGNGPVQFSGGG